MQRLNLVTETVPDAELCVSVLTAALKKHGYTVMSEELAVALQPQPQILRQNVAQDRYTELVQSVTCMMQHWSAVDEVDSKLTKNL